MTTDTDTDNRDHDATVIGLLRNAAVTGWGDLLGTVALGQAGLRRVALSPEEIGTRFTEAYQRERPALLRLVGSRLGHGAAAEDVVQRAFISVWQQLQRPDRPEIASLARYTCTAVTREVYRELRAIIPERRRRSDDEVPERADPATLQAPDAPAMDALREALDTLTERQRQAVVLRFQAERDVRETAELMKVSEGAVKRYTSDGLARLRDHLGQQT